MFVPSPISSATGAPPSSSAWRAGARPDEDVAPDRDPPLALEAHGRLEPLPRPKDANAPAASVENVRRRARRTIQTRPTKLRPTTRLGASHVSILGSAWSGVRSPFVGDPISA